jgi:prophage antirepressor-like protein
MRLNATKSKPSVSNPLPTRNLSELRNTVITCLTGRYNIDHQLKNLANPFQFSELDIRTATDEHSEVWFCAKDACAALDVVCSESGTSATLENMSNNWLTVWKLQTIQGERDAVFINEAGLYHFIFRSNKPKAKEFANWVYETALPEIRRAGFFGTIDTKEQINISKQAVSISLQITRTKNAYRRRILQGRLR